MRLAAALLLAGLPAVAADIAIGYYGPDDPAHPVGGAYWQGATLAIEDANREGGYRGSPFRLVQGWDDNPWTGGAAVVVRMAYKERVWAIIGGIDGTSTHLAEQVVAKALLALIDPASTDRTVNAAFVPWMFSCSPDDRALMEALGEALLDGPYRDAFALAAATDHDSRITTTEFVAVLNRLQARPRRRADFQPGSQDLAAVVDHVRDSGAKAIVVLAGPQDSAALVAELRRAMPELAIFGGPAMATRTFTKLARSSARGVRYAQPLGEPDSAFARRFQERWGVEPDPGAYHAYDAAGLVVAAIRDAGLDRTAIRDALKALSPWKGVSGVIEWDKLGRNARRAAMAVHE
ncbi:MAG: ABC transporter substrate-binding protein [Bryobacteraceae bacterium]|nr:ABC transporter substrate-binding protein [Bryobacteraceae bacterium]